MASSTSGCSFVIHISVFVPKHVSYLLLKEMPSYTFGEASTFGGAGMGKAVGGEMTGPPMADHPMRGSPGAISSDLLTYGRNKNLTNQFPVDAMPRPGHETVPLLLDASSTLYVERLPPDSTRREVAHIFRPFVGYKAVRLVSKESKHVVKWMNRLLILITCSCSFTSSRIPGLDLAVTGGDRH